MYLEDSKVFYRLFATLVLAGTFLGGYYLGHKPQSPDIFAWAQRTYRQAAESSNRLAGSKDAPDADALPGKVMIEGKTYVIDGGRLLAQ